MLMQTMCVMVNIVRRGPCDQMLNLAGTNPFAKVVLDVDVKDDPEDKIRSDKVLLRPMGVAKPQLALGWSTLRFPASTAHDL